MLKRRMEFKEMTREKEKEKQSLIVGYILIYFFLKRQFPNKFALFYLD